MKENRKTSAGFFDVVVEKQTYLNILYLMVSFPLGIAYFIFLTTGLSLGLGLSILFVGLPVIYLVFVISSKLMRFEQKLAEIFLGMRFVYTNETRPRAIGFLRNFRETIFDVDIWRSMMYLIFKFFIGMLIFSIALVLISLSLGLMSVPVLYQLAESGIFIELHGFHGITDYLDLGISPYQESIIWMITGIFLGIASLHIFNLMAFVSGQILHYMSPVQKKIKKEKALILVK